MLTSIDNDHELLAVVQTLEYRGHGAWLERWIEAALSAPHPADRARALTAAGFMASPEPSGRAERSLLEPTGPGWLAEIQVVARCWRDRASQMQHWARRLLRAEEEHEAWAANALLKSVMDDRHSIWWGKRPYCRQRDWRSQWINFDAPDRLTTRKAAGSDLKHTRFHTRTVGSGILPPPFVHS